MSLIETMVKKGGLAPLPKQVSQVSQVSATVGGKENPSAGAGSSPTVASVATVATLPHDLTPADAHSRFRLPDGRTLWVSPPETLERIQARHPGADAATVTEATSAEEAAAIAYCERVARDRAAGRVPGSYTATTHCRGCGTVHIFAGVPARVDACPWCFNRAKGLPIPRPEVTCGECQHFTHDPQGGGGIGTCARGGPPKGQMPAYPHTRRRCPDFEAAKGKLA